MNVKCLIVKDWTIFTIFTIHNIKFQMGEGGGVRSGQPLLKYFLKCLLNDMGKPQKHLSLRKKKIFKHNSYPTGTQLVHVL